MRARNVAHLAEGDGAVRLRQAQTWSDRLKRGWGHACGDFQREDTRVDTCLLLLVVVPRVGQSCL